MLDWSYSLLSEPERIVFRRLSVFAGGWTRDAAEHMAGDGEQDPGIEARSALDVLDVLARLVDTSLVVSEASTEHTPRYRYLETIRQYAREKLLESGEEAQVRDRHLAFFLQFAEETYPKLRGPE
jgi:predicted ATPase